MTVTQGLGRLSVPKIVIQGLVAALLAIATVACEGSTTREVQGVLVDVQNRDLVNAEHISLRDAAGLSIIFWSALKSLAIPNIPLPLLT